MKTLLSLVCFVIVTAASNLVAQPTILYPTNNQVLHQGDKIDITWIPRRGAWQDVVIGLQDNLTGAIEWVGFQVPNNGKYTWTVGTWGLDSEYTLAIMDGGNIANVSTVEVTIPPAPIQVPVSIRRTISVEWQANTNHLYEIQTSTDLKSWTATGEAFKPAQTNASASFYAEKPTQYFRVFDKTP